MTTGEFLVDQIDGTRQWTLTLLADLNGDEWTFQPKPGLHHALWLCGHLTAAQHSLVFNRCLGKPFLDAAFMAHFPMGGPVKSATEHDYPPARVVLTTMADVHRQTLDAVRGMSDAVLAEAAFGADGKTPHPNYKDKRGAVSHASRHEAFHAGQIALLRRLMGKGFLR